MFHYIYSVHRKPNTDTSDYQGLGTPDPHPTSHSLFKLGKKVLVAAAMDYTRSLRFWLFCSSAFKHLGREIDAVSNSLTRPVKK